MLKATGFNMAQTEGRCQLPGTKEEAWRASGNEPGWVLAAGGDSPVLQRGSDGGKLVLVPEVAQWRYAYVCGGGTEMLWYSPDSVKLYRQKGGESWARPIHRLAEDL